MTRDRLRWARAVALLGLLLPAACSNRLSAAQIAVLKQEGFKPVDDDWSLGLSDRMLFDVGSDVLKPPTVAAVEKTGAALKSVDIRNVRVEGHTDNTGSDTLNMDLSQRRAKAVAQALGASGMAGPIGVQGYGKTKPVADNATEAGRAENRRVAVIVPSDQSDKK